MAANREAFRFFMEQAGYVVGRRAEGALALARAEQLLEEAQEIDVATVDWKDDDVPYDPGDAFTEDEASAKFESGAWTGPLGCIVAVGGDQAPREIASLWGIVLGSRGTGDPYARVVVAELALELVDELRQAIGDARDAELASDLLDRVRAAEEAARAVGDSVRAEEVYALGLALGSFLSH